MQTDEFISGRLGTVARRLPDSPAMLAPDGSIISFGAMMVLVHGFSAKLTLQGLKPGARVSIYIDDPVASMILTFALLHIGAEIYMVPKEVASRADQGLIEWIVVTAEQTGSDKRQIVLGEDWLAPPGSPVPKQGLGSVVTGSSGTTGTPKFQRSSEAVLIARAEAELKFRKSFDGPVFSGFGIRTAIALTLNLGILLSGNMILFNRNDEEVFLQDVEKHKVTSLRMPPLDVAALSRYLEASGKSLIGPKRIIVSGGAISPELAAKVEVQTGSEVYNYIGSSEAGAIAHHRPTDTPGIFGNVGQIYPHLTSRFLDENGNETDPLEGGELCLKVPPRIRKSQYLNAEGPYDKNGWVRTGDMGHLTESGDLIIAGRRHEMINVGGNKHAPSQFEKSALRMEAVHEAAAFAIRNEDGLDEIGLAVVGSPSLTEQAVHHFVSSKLPPNYRVRVMLLSELPSNSAGKIDRKKLLAEYLEHQKAISDQAASS